MRKKITVKKCSFYMVVVCLKYVCNTKSPKMLRNKRWRLKFIKFSIEENEKIFSDRPKTTCLAINLMNVWFCNLCTHTRILLPNYFKSFMIYLHNKINVLRILFFQMCFCRRLYGLFSELLF